MQKYYPVIGIEVHAELKTNSKMFCACKNDADETRPNVNICPVCMAHPGTLPVPNKKAIESVIKVGLAIDGTIANFSEFDRKNYFYPDIPKGYQISQYKYPIVSGGHLADFAITRIHLEEDTANSKHLPTGQAGDKGYSLIDYNRAGVPLMELVTEAHMFDSVENASKATSTFGRELQLLLTYLGVSEANMEKGEMRVEANMSLTEGSVLEANGLAPIVGHIDLATYKPALGIKVEVKNLNSFRSVERAIIFEMNRMQKLIEEGRGGELVQETRGWDEAKQSTYSQRTKEDAHDYRYFPEPDIPKFYLHEMFDLENLKSGLAETPAEKRARFGSDYGIKSEDIESYINDTTLGNYFESVAQNLNPLPASPLSRGGENAETSNSSGIFQILSNYLTSDFVGLNKTNPSITFPSAPHMAELVTLFANGDISSRVAKDLLARIAVSDTSPKQIAENEDLYQKNDTEGLKVLAQKMIDENPEVVATYKSGKENAIMSLVGKIIKESNGSANPQLALQTLKDLLK